MLSKIIILAILLAVLIALDGDYIKLRLKTWRILDASAGIILLLMPVISLWVESH